MRNRQLFTDRNEYDLLCMMQENIEKHNKRGDKFCVLDILDGSIGECKEKTCKECIQTWLNAERK